MTIGVSELLLFLGLAAVLGIIGLGFGIVVLAPRLTRLADRDEDIRDEESGA